MTEALVVDCSVAAKWTLIEPGDVEASRLLDEQEAGRVSLIARDLLLVEFASLIAKRVRRKQLSVDRAHEMFWIVKHSDVELFETRRLLGAALELALRLTSLFGIAYILPWRLRRTAP